MLKAGAVTSITGRGVSAMIDGEQIHIGKQGLFSEVDGALEHHELIKIKVAAADRDERDQLIGQIAQRAGAALVQRIGHVAVLYRPSKDKRQIVLPRA